MKELLAAHWVNAPRQIKKSRFSSDWQIKRIFHVLTFLNTLSSYLSTSLHFSIMLGMSAKHQLLRNFISLYQKSELYSFGILQQVIRKGAGKSVDPFPSLLVQMFAKSHFCLGYLFACSIQTSETRIYPFLAFFWPGSVVSDRMSSRVHKKQSDSIFSVSLRNQAQYISFLLRNRNLNN